MIGEPPVAGSAGDIDEVMGTMTCAFPPDLGEAWTRAQCLGMLGLPGTMLLLARERGQPVGFALARVILDDSELLLLAVRPQARGRGQGAALVRAVADRAKRNGAVRLHLEMREHNPAHRLYRHLGFREAGRRPGYYRQAGGRLSDALTLTLSLTDADR